MIIDQIKHAGIYGGVHAGIKSVLHYLNTTDVDTLPPGRVSIDGERLFAIVEQYETKPRENVLWEAHRRYIDLQYVVAGVEVMGYANVDILAVSEAYDSTKDIVRLTGDGSFVAVPSGTFVLFLPQDGHMPGLVVDRPATVRKIVFKIQC